MPAKTYVQTTINGEHVDFLCEPRQSLLECLRDVIGLTGPKEGCHVGNCGAGTVMLEGRIVTSRPVLRGQVGGGVQSRRPRTPGRDRLRWGFALRWRVGRPGGVRLRCNAYGTESKRIPSARSFIFSWGRW